MHRQQTTTAHGNLWRIRTALQRFGRSCGFGIHSPFAYDFVRRVLRQPCAYYAYDEIDRLARQARIPSDYMRLLFRVALHLQPSAVAIIGDHIDICSEILTLALPETTIQNIRNATNRSDADFMVIFGNVQNDTEITSDIHALTDRGGSFIIFDMTIEENLLISPDQELKHGMSFSNGRTVVYVGKRHLPRQHFDIWL